MIVISENVEVRDGNSASEFEYSGDQNRVVVWSLKEDRLIRKFRVSTKTSVIRSIDSSSVIFCGHNNGTLTSYTAADHQIHTFQAHTSTVFTLDISKV